MTDYFLSFSACLRKQQQPGSDATAGRTEQGLLLHPIISFLLNAVNPSPKNCWVNGLLVVAKSPSFPMEVLCNTTGHLMLCSSKGVHYTQEEENDG